MAMRMPIGLPCTAQRGPKKNKSTKAYNTEQEGIIASMGKSGSGVEEIAEAVSVKVGEKIGAQIKQISSTEKRLKDLTDLE